MKINKNLLLVLISLILSTTVYSQIQSAGTINSLISSIDTFRNKLPVEKLYIQFDKPYYTTSDTLWFKAYLLDAAYLKSSMRSGLLYIELVNDTGKVLDRRMLSLSYGLGRGNIVLNKENIPEGSYTLRAYTNWMRNFGEDYVFKKTFYIGSSGEQSWLISSAMHESLTAGRDSIRLALLFRQLNGESLGLRELQLRLMDGKKTLFRDKVTTEFDGKLDVNFTLPEKADTKNISLIAEGQLKGVENPKITIPIAINRPENMDLQFMPEGGNLVAGIFSRIGFKAVSEDGKGIEVTGKIYSDIEEAAVFSSLHKGMGSFELTPKAGKNYTAKVLLPDGTTKSYPLPAVKSSGTVLRINNTKESDSLELRISITPDLLTATGAPPAYYLIGQSRGVVCYAARIIQNSKESLKKIPKSAFPTGIARFTLLTTNMQPLNERIAYIDRKDQLRISVTPDKESYKTRDSIALAIEVKDKEGKPVRGSFSLAVTDNSQVKTDSTTNNILTNFLLTSDLKGNIEEPNYYLQSTSQAWDVLDHLLLTQGWVGYDPIAIGWKDVFNPAPPVYAAESEFMVTGKVMNVLNKPLEGTGILLFSTRPVFTMNTLTAHEGMFSFKGFPPLDTVKFVIQARNKNNKSFNVGIEVDEYKPPVFKPFVERFIPWYLNSDTSLLKNISTKIAQQKELERIPGGNNLLNEVVITGKKIIKDSHNLNGPGEADQVLDDKELQQTPKMSLLNLMHQKIKGFTEGRFPSGRQIQAGLDVPPLVPITSYKIFEKEIHLIIDGVDVENFYLLPTNTYILERNALSERDQYDRRNFIKMYLDYILAEDVKGIEVMHNMKYNSRYNSSYAATDVIKSLDPITSDFAYIEITTYSGKGPYMNKIPGTYFYKSMPFAGAKKFYRPKYSVKDSAKTGDLRSTIHWEPDVVTDKEGKAMVSFYSADRPGSYTVILEGSDLNGNIGYQRKKIIITSK